MLHHPIDAAGCQKNIAEKIVNGGADYVLSLKGNQSNLHEAVENWIITNMENDFADVTVRRHEEIVKGHGRTDHLIYYQLKAPDSLPGRNNWKGLRTIGIAIRMSQQGDKETSDVRYFISSLRLGVKRFAQRGSQALEHREYPALVPDVTFREDDNRLRDRFAADNLAWLKRFAISLLKQRTDKESVAMRRRMAGWNTDYLAQVLGIKAT